MASKCIVLLDNSNVFIEGRKLSALQKGHECDQLGKRVQDPSWRFDFGRLLDFVANDRGVVEAVLVGSQPPDNDSVWDQAKAKEWTVVLHDKSSRGTEKCVDTELAVKGTELILTYGSDVDVIIVSGDEDFLPLLRFGKRKGCAVEVCAFTSAIGSGKLPQEAHLVRPLDPGMSSFGFHDFAWP